MNMDHEISFQCFGFMVYLSQVIKESTGKGARSGFLMKSVVRYPLSRIDYP